VKEIIKSIQRRIADKTVIANACLAYAEKTGSSAAVVALLCLREVVDSLPNQVNRPDAKECDQCWPYTSHGQRCPHCNFKR
jgi:hypothetical protein